MSKAYIARRLSWECFRPYLPVSIEHICPEKLPSWTYQYKIVVATIRSTPTKDEYSGDYAIGSIKSISAVPNDRKWSIWCSIKTVLVRRIMRRSEPLGASGLHQLLQSHADILGQLFDKGVVLQGSPRRDGRICPRF